MNSFSLSFPSETIEYTRPITIVTPTEKKTIVNDIVDIPDDTYCSCVKTARAVCGDIPYNSDADTFTPNTTPQVGVLALFLFPNNVYHVACVTDINSDGFYIKQGNKERCKYTEEWIPWDYKNLIGFWKNS